MICGQHQTLSPTIHGWIVNKENKTITIEWIKEPPALQQILEPISRFAKWAVIPILAHASVVQWSAHTVINAWRDDGETSDEYTAVMIQTEVTSSYQF